jgi:hypothetical protein
VSYQSDRKWSDTFLDEIRTILGPKLLVPTDDLTDMTRAADLIVIQTKQLAIGVRMRRERWLDYADEFTIRLARKSGAKTEFEKIREGMCDWLFYGFGPEEGYHLTQWTLINLDVFRNQLDTIGTHEFVYNHDKTTAFLPFKYNEFPPELIIDSGPEKRTMPLS